MNDPAPCLDIYALTRHRTREIVDRFLDAYVDVQASEDRGDEELMMVPLGYGGPLADLREWEWRRAGTLSAIIDVILAEPYRAFVVYLAPKETYLCRTILAGTRDGALVFGLSLPDAELGASPEVIERARSLLAELTRLADAQRGAIAVEEPPPLDSAEFAEWVPRVAFSS